MAHCPPEALDDLADLLAELRTWAGVIEKKPNVFYVRRQPFLHFHLVEGGRRRADIKPPFLISRPRSGTGPGVGGSSAQKKDGNGSGLP